MLRRIHLPPLLAFAQPARLHFLNCHLLLDLARRDLVREVQVNIEDGGKVPGFRNHHVLVPDLLKE